MDPMSRRLRALVAQTASRPSAAADGAPSVGPCSTAPEPYFVGTGAARGGQQRHFQKFHTRSCYYPISDSPYDTNRVDPEPAL
jgi:hypothetical protein